MNTAINSIQDAIDYIETHLGELDLSLSSVAARAGYSPGRFSELFHFLVGETYQGYITGRRLTRCAAELLETDRRIVDIACDWGFSSQSTFTRGFRNIFGMTPAQYRKRGAHIFVEKPCLSRRYDGLPLQSLNPRFETIDEIQLVGMQFSWSVATGYNVREWWDAFLPRIDEIEGADTERYFGLCSSPTYILENGHGSNPLYLASVAVAHEPQSVPKDLVHAVLPGGEYAVFTVEKGISGLIDTCRYIWGTWVAHNGVTDLETDNVDVYPPEVFTQNKTDLPVEIWYPIAKR